VAVIFCLLLALLALVSCGSSTPSTSTAATSGLTFRALLSNATVGTVWLLDAKLDKLSLLHPTFSAGLTAPGLMSVSQDKKETLVLGNGTPNLSVLNNVTEAVSAGPITLPGVTESAVFSADGATVFAAVRSTPVFGQPPGAIIAVSVSSATISATIPVPDAHYVAISPDGRRLLVLSDTTNTATIVYTSLIDTPSQATQVITLPFDRPVAALFSTDGNTAYIVNCGPECGGTQASVSVVDLSPLPNNPVLLGNVPVPAATVALLNTTTLYVAGTSPTNNSCSSGGVSVCGRLTSINLAGLTAGTPIEITNGYHTTLALGANNLLFAGAIGCTNRASTRGCLAIYDTQKQSMSVAVATGDVTAIQPIRNRTMVYVAQNGELVIYDTTTGQPIDSLKQIDVVGQAFDIKLID
jgi:hypothetical protein